MKDDNDSDLKVAIFGGRGSGAATASYLEAAGRGAHVLGYLNDMEVPGTRIGDYSVLGGFSDWSGLAAGVKFNAPLHKAGENEARLERVRALGIPPERWLSIVHPMSAIAYSTIVGHGASIGPFTSIQPGVSLGRHVAVRSNNYIGHDTEVGDFTFIGAGASIAGYCRISTGVFIGVNASVRDKITVGHFAVIGMGACVTRDVADYEIVSGNPARRVGYVQARDKTEW